MSNLLVATVLLGQYDVILHEGDRVEVREVLLGHKPGVVQVAGFVGLRRRVLEMDPMGNAVVVGMVRR